MHKKVLDVRLARTPDGDSITVIYQGRSYDATDEHPMFEKIVAGALADDPEVIKLFDIGSAIATRTALSDRFSYADGKLFFDGDELSGDLADGIMGVIGDGEDPKILVNFAERLMNNPEKHSREQLYTFLRGQKFTMTPEGRLIMYKGVTDTGEKDDGKERYLSVNGGVAIINGVYHESGPVPQHVGDFVEMPRSMVEHNPSNACSVGLHAATFAFAKNFAYDGVVLELEVDPRDVVSVPTHERSKVRVSRYRVLGVVDRAHSTSVRREETKEKLKHVKTEGKHPSHAIFSEFRASAKRQKMGLKKYCERHGLKLVKGDGKSREDWVVVEKPR